MVMRMKISKLALSVSEVKDPRRDYGNLMHNIRTLLVIGLLSTLCGGKDYRDMEVFAKTKYEWLSGFLNLDNGAPDSDTFRRVFERVNSDELLKSLNNWLIDSNESISHVALDGKTICGSGNDDHRAYQLVSAWASDQGLCLGQLVVDEKSNEIKAIPKILDFIDVRGAVVTIDAMGCQFVITEKIREKDADYVLALKKNHKSFYNKVVKAFEKTDNSEILFEGHIDRWSDKEYNHGRYDERIITVIPANSVKVDSKWVDVNSLVRVRHIQTINGNTVTTDRYFISSLPPNARRLARVIRKHWEIENKLHWVLDVVFEEDSARARKNNSPINMNVLRKIAISLLSKEKQYTKLSYKKLMFKDALDSAFLELVLFRR
jgi:predicted transposase YbfD/YdcC